MASAIFGCAACESTLAVRPDRLCSSAPSRPSSRGASLAGGLGQRLDAGDLLVDRGDLFGRGAVGALADARDSGFDLGDLGVQRLEPGILACAAQFDRLLQRGDIGLHLIERLGQAVDLCPAMSPGIARAGLQAFDLGFERGNLRLHGRRTADARAAGAWRAEHARELQQPAGDQRDDAAGKSCSQGRSARRARRRRDPAVRAALKAAALPVPCGRMLRSRPASAHRRMRWPAPGRLRAASVTGSCVSARIRPAAPPLRMRRCLPSRRPAPVPTAAAPSSAARRETSSGPSSMVTGSRSDFECRVLGVLTITASASD